MSKYNAKKTVYDGIKFDSKVEMEYYIHLLNLKNKGIIDKIILQPRYELLEKFTKGTRNYRKMEYVADFEIHFSNGIVIVVDIKGLPTEVAKLKRKLFDYKYRNIKLYWIKKKSKRWVNI